MYFMGSKASSNSEENIKLRHALEKLSVWYMMTKDCSHIL
jgi:hypothetical protein